MKHRNWPFSTMNMYTSITYKDGDVIPAVRRASQLQNLNWGVLFFSTLYPSPTSVIITRVPSEGEATRDKRCNKGMVHDWPFMFMLLGHSATYKGKDIHHAVLRVYSLKHAHPDLHFSIRYPRRGTCVITREADAASVVRESRDGRRKWPFKDMNTGETVTFNVMFMSTKYIIRICDAAHGTGDRLGWKFKVKTSVGLDCMKTTTVTRIT